ncbi:MAG: hypothetical protein JXA44_02780 [Methanospirillaceae archaeon]|nr:hypothetical protein [Methanospirillaceae archaeon]
MSEDRYKDRYPKLSDVLFWCRDNRVTPVPCSPRSKKPVSAISKRTLYGDDPAGSGFLTPTPERLSAIDVFWEQYGDVYNHNHVSVSLVADPGYNQGRNLCCLDVDTDDLMTTFLSSPLLSRCPAVSGGKGVKIFFFTDSVPVKGILQWKKRGDLRHPVFELFTWHKHALIYGEHPASSQQRPVMYRWLLGMHLSLPLIVWQDLAFLLLDLEQRFSLSATGTVGQQDLSGWF